MHVMLDLETWGTKPGSALRSLGAVIFDLEGNIGQGVYCNIDRQSCLDAGLSIDPDTERWWSQQSSEAQAALLIDPRPLAEVADRFHAWWQAKRCVHVWSQGANFDEPLWVAACRAVGKSVPWKFFNARDTRTVYDLFGFDPRSLSRAGTYHNALDDAKHQVRCVHAALARGRAARAA